MSCECLNRKGNYCYCTFWNKKKQHEHPHTPISGICSYAKSGRTGRRKVQACLFHVIFLFFVSFFLFILLLVLFIFFIVLMPIFFFGFSVGVDITNYRMSVCTRMYICFICNAFWWREHYYTPFTIATHIIYCVICMVMRNVHWYCSYCCCCQLFAIFGYDYYIHAYI